MAGTRIEENIRSSTGQVAARTFRHPGILTDFKTDHDPAAVENQIAQRVVLPVNDRFCLDSSRPGFEPAGFVVDPLTRQILFGCKTNNVAIRD